jgi:hypothetical protein
LKSRVKIGWINSVFIKEINIFISKR